MNPKNLAAASAISLVVFLFLLVTAFFAAVGAALFALMGDAAAFVFFAYFLGIVGILSLTALLVTIVSNTLLLTYRL